MVNKGLVLLLLVIIVGCASVDGGDNKNRASTTNVQLAIGYLQQGRMEVAKQKIERALEADPSSTDAHVGAALIYERLNEIDKADDHYRTAIDLSPKDGSVYNNYGVFLCNQKRLAEAIENFLKAADMPRYPTPERAFENAGACARQIPDLEKAEAYLRKALSKDPKLPNALYEMAQISYAKHKHLSVRAYLQRYEEVARHTPQSLWLGIQVERHLGDKQAEARYAKLLQTKFPKSNEFKKLLDEHERETGT